MVSPERMVDLAGGRNSNLITAETVSYAFDPFTQNGETHISKSILLVVSPVCKKRFSMTITKRSIDASNQVISALSITRSGLRPKAFHAVQVCIHGHPWTRVIKCLWGPGLPQVSLLWRCEFHLACQVRMVRPTTNMQKVRADCLLVFELHYGFDMIWWDVGRVWLFWSAGKLLKHLAWRWPQFLFELELVVSRGQSSAGPRKCFDVMVHAPRWFLFVRIHAGDLQVGDETCPGSPDPDHCSTPLSCFLC